VQIIYKNFLSNFYHQLKNIKFWLFFFFIIRLFGITNPPLEKGHDWRQCLTNMTTRNLYETSNNPMYPMVDNGGRHESGIIASEFPLYNYAAYLIALPFGYAHWYGRLINLILSTIATWYFYKLLKKFFTESISFNSTYLLSISIWFGFARKTMPDIFSISLIIIALFYAFSFLTNYKWWQLAAFGLFGSMAVLAKLPAIYALSILVIPILDKQYLLWPKISIITISIFVFLISYWWYFIWGDYLYKTWGYQLFFPRTVLEGITEIKPYLSKAIEQFYFSAFQSFIAFFAFLYGFYLCIKNKIKNPLTILAVTFPVFLTFILKTGNVFALHNYYIIPFVPIMVIIAGIGLSNIPLKFYPWVLAFITIEAIGNQQNDFFIKDSEKFKLSLEKDINFIVPKNEKIAMAGITGPQYIYFSHRKGWGLSPEQTLDTNYMNFLIKRNYKYMVLVKREFTTLPSYKLIDENNNIIIYSIK